jgi:hypothetical protein
MQRGGGLARRRRRRRADRGRRAFRVGVGFAQARRAARGSPLTLVLRSPSAWPT